MTTHNVCQKVTRFIYGTFFSVTLLFGALAMAPSPALAAADGFCYDNADGTRTCCNVDDEGQITDCHTEPIEDPGEG